MACKALADALVIYCFPSDVFTKPFIDFLFSCAWVSFFFAGIANGYASNVRYQFFAFSLQCFVTGACLVLAFVRLDLLQVSLLLFMVMLFAVVVKPPVIVQYFGMVTDARCCLRSIRVPSDAGRYRCIASVPYSV